MLLINVNYHMSKKQNVRPVPIYLATRLLERKRSFFVMTIVAHGDCSGLGRCDTATSSPEQTRPQRNTVHHFGATGNNNSWRNGRFRPVNFHPKVRWDDDSEPSYCEYVPWGKSSPQRAVMEPAHNNTCGNIKHAFLTPRSFATRSTISRVTTIMSGPSASRPFFPRILRRPHSFIANAASSTLRFVARARSANVHFTTT